MTDPLDPAKFHIMTDSQKKTLYTTGFILILLVLPLFFYFYYNLAIHRTSQLDRELSFEIKRGDKVLDIAKSLYQKGAINSEFLFPLYVFLNKNDTSIQAGVYTIKAGTPLIDVVKQFQHGVNDAKITFIEGWRIEEFARAASIQFGKIDYSEFVRRAAQYEGYLFPDTYFFDKDVHEDEMVANLRATFDSKTKDLLTETNLVRVGLTKDQVVILASIVEREVNKDEDRPVVAGILLKRFKQGLKLDADATTQYTVAANYLCGANVAVSGVCAAPITELNQFNWWPKNLTQADLDFDSVFNTRKNVGFPPHPISNPGLSAISAVVNYTPSDYLFYLTDSAGKTHYAKTLEEHNVNIAKFLQ